jgi:hypothetical protein
MIGTRTMREHFLEKWKQFFLLSFSERTRVSQFYFVKEPVSDNIPLLTVSFLNFWQHCICECEFRRMLEIIIMFDPQLPYN